MFFTISRFTSPTIAYIIFIVGYVFFTLLSRYILKKCRKHGDAYCTRQTVDEPCKSKQPVG